VHRRAMPGSERTPGLYERTFVIPPGSSVMPYCAQGTKNGEGLHVDRGMEAERKPVEHF
jgi:hypothetical protein